MTMKSKINRFSHNGYTQEGNTIRKSGEILTNLPPKTAVWVGSGGVQAVSHLSSGHIRNIIKYVAKNWLKTPNSTISGNWVDELLDRFAAVELSKVLAEKHKLLAQIECLTGEVSTLKCAVEDTAYLLADVRHLENQLKWANEQIDDLQQLVEDLKAYNADADALAAECRVGRPSGGEPTRLRACQAALAVGAVSEWPNYRNPQQDRKHHRQGEGMKRYKVTRLSDGKEEWWMGVDAHDAYKCAVLGWLLEWSSTPATIKLTTETDGTPVFAIEHPRTAAKVVLL